jgi:hypothetical protein
MSILSDLIANKDRILSVISDIKTSLINRGISDVSDIITDYPEYINSISQTNASRIGVTSRLNGFSYTITSLKVNDIISTMATPTGNTNEYLSVDTTNKKLVALKRCTIVSILATHVGTNTLNSYQNYVVASFLLEHNGESTESGGVIATYDMEDTIAQSIFQLEAGDALSVKVLIMRPTAAATSNTYSPLVSVFAGVHILYDT